MSHQSHSDLQRTWQTAQADYLLSVQARSSAKNLHYHRTQLNGLIRWAVSQEIALPDFAARHFRRYLVFRAEKGISDRTRHHDTVVANMFFQFCADEEIIPRNILANYEKPRVPRASVPKPSVEDVRAVLEVIKKRWDTRTSDVARCFSPAARKFYMARDTAIICTLIATAGRAGEVLALGVADIDLDSKQIVFRVTKGKRPRTVPISALCVDVLRAWLDARPKLDNDLLFVSNTGEQIQVSGFGRQFVRYVKAAGVTKFTLHGLRHFAATEIAKVDLFAAMLILGHQEARTTMIYAHEDADHVRDAYDKASPLDKILIEKRAAKAKRKRIV